MLTQHNDERRSGVQLETLLNTSNVHAGTFGKLFTRTLPVSPNSTSALKDRIYGQPLLVTNAVPNVVIVATDTNMVYAFDAQNAGASAPLWSANSGPPESAIDNWTDDHCNRSLPVIGVLSTPVIDPNQKALYVVSKNRKGGVTSTAVSFTIHKLDVASGSELASLQIPQGVQDFVPYHQLQRAGLVFVPSDQAPGGGFVYAAFGGHCDFGTDWHGWVFGFDGNLQKQVASFNTTPDGSGGGVWQAGQAPVHQSLTCTGCARDVLYLSTGNGSRHLAQSVLRLDVKGDGSLSLGDSFTPYNQTALNNCDADVASTGPVLLDDSLVVGGKQGVLYVLKINNLSHGVANETQANLDGTKNQTLCQNSGGGGGFTNGYVWNQNGDDVLQEFQAVSPHFVGPPKAKLLLAISMVPRCTPQCSAVVEQVQTLYICMCGLKWTT